MWWLYLILFLIVAGGIICVLVWFRNNVIEQKENIEKDIVNLFEKEGYSIIEKNYEDKIIRIKYKCPKGHIHVTTWRNFKSGCRCPYCDGQKIEFEEITVGDYLNSMGL